jgi:Protein of unknown function (DUF3298)
MRVCFLLSFCILITSCHQANNKQTASVKEPAKDSTKKNRNCIIDSKTRDTIGLAIPADFQFDSLLKRSSPRNMEIQIIYPKSLTCKIADKEMSSYFTARFKRFINRLDSLIRDDRSMLQSTQSTFNADPVSIFRNDKLLSYRFIISTDYGGFVHPFTEYYSFNFDLAKNRQIKFYEFFNIQSKEDSLYLLNAINKAIDCEYIYLKKLRATDFTIEEENITFNFDDYEIAGYSDGIIKAIVSKKKLSKIIANKYQ